MKLWWNMFVCLCRYFCIQSRGAFIFVSFMQNVLQLCTHALWLLSGWWKFGCLEECYSQTGKASHQPSWLLTTTQLPLTRWPEVVSLDPLRVIYTRFGQLWAPLTSVTLHWYYKPWRVCVCRYRHSVKLCMLVVKHAQSLWNRLVNSPCGALECIVEEICISAAGRMKMACIASVQLAWPRNQEVSVEASLVPRLHGKVYRSDPSVFMKIFTTFWSFFLHAAYPSSSYYFRYVYISTPVTSYMLVVYEARPSLTLQKSDFSFSWGVCEMV